MEEHQKKLEELTETVKNLSLAVEKLQNENTKLQTLVNDQEKKLQKNVDQTQYLTKACGNTISNYHYDQYRSRDWDPGDSD